MIEPGPGVPRDHLEIVSDHHRTEDAVTPEEHGQVAVDAVAEGQEDDGRLELIRDERRGDNKSGITSIMWSRRLSVWPK